MSSVFRLTTMMSHSRLGAVWVLLVAAAAVELYDDLSPGELDHELVYQDDNDIDTGPLRVPHGDDTAATRLKDLLLYRLIESHMRRLRSTEHKMHKEPTHDIFEGSSGLMKRFAQGGARPQQRWKAKKGKVIGSQMVCYFKLCAFRNPS